MTSRVRCTRTVHQDAGVLVARAMSHTHIRHRNETPTTTVVVSSSEGRPRVADRSREPAREGYDRYDERRRAKAILSTSPRGEREAPLT